MEWTGYWVMNLVTRLAMCSHPIWWSPKPLTHWPRTISGMSSWLNHQASECLGPRICFKQPVRSELYLWKTHGPWWLQCLCCTLFWGYFLPSRWYEVGLPSRATTPSCQEHLSTISNYTYLYTFLTWVPRCPIRLIWDPNGWAQLLKLQKTKHQWPWITMHAARCSLARNSRGARNRRGWWGVASPSWAETHG